MSRYYPNKKTETDDCRRLSIFDLERFDFFIGYNRGSIVWTNHYGEKNTIGVDVTTYTADPHVRLYYTQTDIRTGTKEDLDYRIPLTTTPCNLGGKRYWFICPWQVNGTYCGRRVGVLYKGTKYFACRHCYNLTYSSRNQNRRFYMYHLGKMMDLERKIEKIETTIKTKYYKGKPTKKYLQLLNLQRLCYSPDMMDHIQTINKRMESILETRRKR